MKSTSGQPKKPWAPENPLGVDTGQSGEQQQKWLEVGKGVEALNGGPLNAGHLASFSTGQAAPPCARAATSHTPVLEYRNVVANNESGLLVRYHVIVTTAPSRLFCCGVAKRPCITRDNSSFDYALINQANV